MEHSNTSYNPIKIDSIMTKLDNMLIEAAYLAGFEPSVDDLTGEALFNEAQTYLCTPRA